MTASAAVPTSALCQFLQPLRMTALADGTAGAIALRQKQQKGGQVIPNALRIADPAGTLRPA